MDVMELKSLSEAQVAEVVELMGELDPEIPVTGEMVRKVLRTEGAHFFAAVDEEGRIVGCATLCVFVSPTGVKASVEDVVVSEKCRGQHLGRRLMEHVIEYARREIGAVDLHLTSRPHRVEANALYRSLGFEPKETNVYVMKIL